MFGYSIFLYIYLVHFIKILEKQIPAFLFFADSP
jgi:hypothetical protein